MAIDRVYLRTSERVAFKTCRQQWHWTYNDKLQPKNVNRHLKFGDLVHQAMARYYKPGVKRGPHPAVAFEDIWKERMEEGFSIKGDDDEWVDALELGIEMLRHYVDHWGTDDHIKVLWSEMPFQVDLYHNGVYMVTYAGTFDCMYYDLEKKQVGMFEHKTAATISTSHLMLDEQAGSYWAFAGEWLRDAGILKPGKEISFIMYNFLRKAKPDDRPRNAAGHYLNKDGSVSKKQPGDYFKRQKIYRGPVDRENLLLRVKMEAWEMAQVRAGKLNVYKNPRGTYPDQHCLGCGFKEMCELHESGADWEDYRDEMMMPYEPNEAHDDPVLEP